MSYSFSISGHVDTQEQEWLLIARLADGIQTAGGQVASAVGNTQFHGIVDLTKVQVTAQAGPAPAQPNEAPPAPPQPLVEVDPAVQAAAVIPSPPVPPVLGPPAPHSPSEAPLPADEANGEKTGLNAAGEVVEANETNSETVAPESVPQANQITIAEPIHNAQGEVVGFVEGTHQTISTAPTETQSDPLYNAAGEVVGYK